MKQCVFLISFFFIFQIFAERTNVNEVNDLFEKNIENKDELMNDLKNQNDNVISNIKSNSIKDIDEVNVQELNSIKDFDSVGRKKRNSEEFKFYDDGEFEPNYTKSGNLAHKLDAEDIAKGTKEKMKDLGVEGLERLIKLQFNCRTVKGPIKKDPTYYIEVKREDQKNTEYDQFYCEELRNEYNCTDSLSLSCLKKGMKWEKWQYKEIIIPGSTIYDSAKNLLNLVFLEKKHYVFWKKRIFAWNLSFDLAGWRLFLSNYLDIPLEQIDTQIHFPNGSLGLGGTSDTGEKHRLIFDSYIFGYNYRDGHEICEKWSDDWNERCVLK